MKPKYWAFVGRVPESENLFWASDRRLPRKEALKAFEEFVFDEEGLSAGEVKQKQKEYGSAIIVDGCFSSESPIETHGEC